MNFNTLIIEERTTKHYFINEGKKLSFLEWINEMAKSDQVIQSFNQLLSESDFKAYFWEVKPVTEAELNLPFEFVLVQSNSLNRISANDSAFSKYFERDKTVVNFANLRGDAELVVPTRLSDNTNYVHLAKFVRTAASHQIIDFWRKVVEIYRGKIGTEPKWLSTSGLGVHWLHARIDSRPKYYQHKEYVR